MERLGDWLEIVGTVISWLAFIALFGGYIALGVYLWIYGAWWAGLVALYLPLGWLAWLAWDALGWGTLAGACFRLRRLVAR